MDLEKVSLTSQDIDSANNLVDDLGEAIKSVGEEYNCERLILHFAALRAIINSLNELPENLDAEFCLKAAKTLNQRAAEINNASTEFEADTLVDILH